jgi:hypothetical protein
MFLVWSLRSLEHRSVLLGTKILQRFLKMLGFERFTVSGEIELFCLPQRSILYRASRTCQGILWDWLSFLWITSFLPKKNFLRA